MLLLAIVVSASVVIDTTASVAATTATSTVHIAYDVSATGPVGVVSLDGTGAHVAGPVGATSPTWKPDGSALAVTTAPNGVLAGVAVVAASGGAAKQVSSAAAYKPSYSPDGSRLLYYTNVANKHQITVENADGTNARVVWNDSKGVLISDFGYLASWAPDGSALAFNAFPAGCLEGACTQPIEVWVVNADGSDLHEVPNAAGIGHVSWSPDGDWLLGDGLVKIHPDGSGRSSVAASGSNPVWSPDGSQIAYEVGAGSTIAGTSLWIVNADGSGAHAVDTPTGNNYDWQPQWLPDGSGLVFTRETAGSSASNLTASIEAVKADGSGLRRLAGGQDPAVPALTTRLAGATRVDTAISVSRTTFASASTIVVARDDLYPDALAAGPLAAQLRGPLLLSAPTGVTPALAAEVKRLGAKTAYLIGDTAALRANVEAGLRAAGITTVNRIGGATRYDTSALIAEQMGGTSIYVVRGDDFPDAASVAGLAAFQRRPILLTPPDALAAAASTAISIMGASSVTIVGGTSAVSADVESSLLAAVADVTRVAGDTRYGTSAAVAALAASAGMTGAPWLADGDNWPDALSAGPAAAAVKGNLLLIDPSSLSGSPDTRAWLAAHPPASVVVVGGPDAVSPLDALQALAGT